MQTLFPTFRRLGERSERLRLYWPRRVRPEQRRALLRLIAVAAEQRIPLGPLVSQWALDERVAQRNRLRRLAALLESGTALPDALEQVPGVLHDEDVLTIRVGSQAGILAPAIRQALDDPDLLSGRTREELRRVFVYAGFMLAIGSLIFAFMQLRIAPMLVRILQDFDSPPTRLMQSLAGLYWLAAQLWWIVGLITLISCWLLFSTRGGRFVRRAIVDKYFGPMRDWRSAEVLERLSTVTAAGRPLPGALSTLARYHFDPAIRHKLLFARNEVEQGADLWQSLKTVKLMSPAEVAVMETATRVGNRSWALRQLAYAKKMRVGRKIEQLSSLLLPLLVVALGGLVLWQATAMFSTLTAIIDSIE